ncbi:putative oxidoreductase of aldo/keto reductase family [Halobacteroides halobius DSM 5150]|uniref:Putative oxidoreductase of aldo/keto reductase family n=1 Tax=Halobacteroides halobius (strain ATCC 35273 / DSM 5150 / MD-1) TaxID=748449 RepID=L0K7C1_HALHC|nr:aldo/keto reductase [Halobacteroides halobius]AGB40901.1 putative oxidoreductase of aldo/keto reductase family [Halobacteroides halobius DSM 5150]
MQYRKLKNSDWQPSALGFGAMRFPTTDEGAIDEKRAIKMIRHAIDQGVNYIDTAWPYHDGESEILVKKALQDGYRKQVKLATKLPSWELETEEDMDYYLDKQLEKLGVDKIDFYLLHALDEDHWKTYQQLNVFDWIEKVQNEGKIDKIGFSFHDDYKLFTEIVDAYQDWDFCQIQYNYLDRDFQAGEKGLEYAADKGLDVIVMEPLKGGTLANEQPKAVQEVWDQADEERTPVDWALQWLWNRPEVSLVLSGMSNLQQVKENIESADQSGIDSLTQQQLDMIDKVYEEYQKLSAVDCTGCGYCVPCPVGVAIPNNFSLYNKAKIYDEYEATAKRYNNMEDKQKSSTCVACGQCEEACPQNLKVSQLLDEVTAYFAKEGEI